MHVTPQLRLFAAVLAALALLAGCAAARPQPGTAGPKGAIFIGFEPIEPEYKSWYCDYDAKDKCARKLWADIRGNAAAVNRQLPNQIATTVIRDYTTDAKVSYLPATVSGSAGYYEVVIDYAKYRTEPVEEDPADAATGADAATTPSILRIGVGVRVVAKVWTTKAGVDLSGLPALSLGVHEQSIYGTLSAHAIGIDSKRINSQLPVGLKLDATAIQTVLQAVAAIQTRIYDDDVTLTPQVLAVKMKEPPTGAQDAKQEAAKASLLKRLFRRQ